jgi:PAS domain S-box-containing protein
MNEDAFRAVIAQAPQGIAILGPDRIIQYANPAFAALHGSDSGKLTGTNLSAITHPDDVAHQIVLYDKIISGETAGFTAEKRILGPNGEYRWLQQHVRAIRTADGRIDFLAEYLTDITRTKASERDWLISNKVVSLLPNPVVITNLEGTFLYANRQFVELLGYREPSELIGQRPVDLSPEPERITEALEALRATGYWQGESLGQKKDGTRFYVKATAYLIRDQADQPICIMASLEDITRKKQFRQDLLIKSHALASSKAGILIADLQGKVMYANQAFLDIGGFAQADEVLNQPNTVFNLPPELLQTILKSVTEEGKWQGDFPVVKKDGSLVHLEVIVTLIVDPEGKPIGRMTSLLDITWRKNAENTLRQLNTDLAEKNQELTAQREELATINEELQQTLEELYHSKEQLENTLQELHHKNFELDQFVYKTSHDLRSPLTTILGLVELLKLETDESAQAHYVQLIENRIMRLDTFIKSMLDYSRNTRTALRVEKINFRQLIRDCLDDLEYLKEFHRLHIRLDINEAVDFYSDAFRLQIIFSNLISNAVKYQNLTQAQNELTIRVHTSETAAEIHFVDNGIGISPEYLDKIFNMFFRASDQSEGSGLGMYIVRQAVQVLQGTIDIRSEPDVGTHISLSCKNQPLR